MINPEELNIEGEEEIDGRLMTRKEEIEKNRIPLSLFYMSAHQTVFTTILLFVS